MNTSHFYRTHGHDNSIHDNRLAEEHSLTSFVDDGIDDFTFPRSFHEVTKEEYRLALVQGLVQEQKEREEFVHQENENTQALNNCSHLLVSQSSVFSIPPTQLQTKLGRRGEERKEEVQQAESKPHPLELIHDTDLESSSWSSFLFLSQDCHDHQKKNDSLILDLAQDEEEQERGHEKSPSLLRSSTAPSSSSSKNFSSSCFLSSSSTNSSLPSCYDVQHPHQTKKTRRGTVCSGELPQDFTPHAWSVIIGRDKTSLEAPGNIRLHAIVKCFLTRYAKCYHERHEKSRIISEIIEFIISSSCNQKSGLDDKGETSKSNTSILGMFIKRINGKWYVAENGMVREKIGRLLRESLHTQYSSSSRQKRARLRHDCHSNDDDDNNSTQ